MKAMQKLQNLKIVLAKLLLPATIILCLLGVSTSTGLYSTVHNSVDGLVLTRAYAEGNSRVKKDSLPYVVVDSDSGISTYVSNVNNQIQADLYVNDGLNTDVTKGWKFLYWDANKKQVAIDRRSYMEMGMNTRKKVMDIALTNLKDTNSVGIGSRDRGRLYSFIEGQDQQVAKVLQAVNSDVTADVSMAMNLLKFFTSPLSTFLGVLCIVISVMILLQMSFDLFCMMTPALMYKLITKGDKPRIMSIEAWTAYKEAFSGTSSSNYMLKYVSKSIPKLLLTGFCMSFIIAGNITYLAMFFANLFVR